MSFLTEKALEGLLKPEPRILTMPDGRRPMFTTSKLVWRYHDYLCAWWGYTPERIVEKALEQSKAWNLPFGLSYPFTIEGLAEYYDGRFNDFTSFEG